MARAKANGESGFITIRPVNIQEIEVPIRGTAPYCQHAFSEKKRNELLQKQMEEEAAKKGGKKKNLPPRDPDAEMRESQHVSEEGWVGIPAASFRVAMISACRLTDIPMTRAKMTVFVVADGLDAGSGQPLVRLDAGEPERNDMAGRLESGTAYVIIRPLWREWGAKVRIRFDGDQLSADSVVNLLNRAGQQVGIGEGRPDSKKSAGLGWGTFEVDTSKMQRA